MVSLMTPGFISVLELSNALTGLYGDSDEQMSHWLNHSLW